MSKLIAINGSPGCGKTTTAAKIAQELYNLTKGVVYYVSFDYIVPSLSYLFPHHKESELFSIGKVFDMTDIYKEDILKQTVTAKGMSNLGYLGFKIGENRYSYPFPTEDKIVSFFDILRGLSDFILVDCTNFSEPITEYALNNADTIVEIISPDFKGITYSVSAFNRKDVTVGKIVRVLNTNDREFFLPVQELRRKEPDIEYVLPFSIGLKKQSITGALTNKLNDRAYHSAVTALARGVI